MNSGWFDTVTVYGPEDLDEEFKIHFSEVLTQLEWLGTEYGNLIL